MSSFLITSVPVSFFKENHNNSYDIPCQTTIFYSSFTEENGFIINYYLTKYADTTINVGRVIN
jgi:hypothetical protein